MWKMKKDINNFSKNRRPNFSKVRRGKKVNDLRQNIFTKYVPFALLIGFALLLLRSNESERNVINAVETKNVNYTKKEIVCLDAGHGAEDIGSVNQDLSETEINLIVVTKVKALLNSAGYEVFMTRTDETINPSNTERAEFCNSHNANVAVSVHHNDYGDSSIDYDTVLYAKENDQGLANTILTSTSTKLNVTNNGISAFPENSFLTKTAMPAALSESFFLTNYDEYEKLKMPLSTRLTDEAQAIYEAIVKYLDNPNQASEALNIHPALDRADL